MESLNIVYSGKIRNRLDEFLASQESIHSRSFASKLIKDGNVKISDIVIKKPSYKLKDGDILEVQLKNFFKEVKIEPEKVPFGVISEGENFLIINKPPGVVVHPGAGNWTGTLVSGLVNYWGRIPEGLDKSRPGIVHRLDKDTSGIILVAKNPLAVAFYSNLFKERNIQKKYLTLVYGKIPKNSGQIIKYIARHKLDRKKMMIVDPEEGRYAETHYKVLDYYQDKSNSDRIFSFVEVLLKTGRTHQIRVHFKDLGYPIVGDSVYAGRKFISLYPKAPRQLLHAYSLKFIDVGGESLKFKAPLPEDFKNYLNSLIKLDC